MGFNLRHKFKISSAVEHLELTQMGNESLNLLDCFMAVEGRFSSSAC